LSREQQRLAIGVEHRGLRLRVDHLALDLLLLGVQVELVHVAPDARRDRGVRLVARAQDGELVLEGAQDLGREPLLGSERPEELAGLLRERDLVAHRQLRGEVARDDEGLACLGRERQRHLVVDRVEFLERGRRRPPVCVQDRQAGIEVQPGAIGLRQVGAHPARRVHALRERQRIDPGLDLLGPELQVFRRGGAFGGGQLQGHGGFSSNLYREDR
jgi:hypothetical protein